MHKMKRIQAKKHKIGTYEIDKMSWSCFHDKRLHTLKASVTSCKKLLMIVPIKKSY